MSPGPSFRHDQLTQMLFKALDPLGAHGLYVGIETSFYLDSQAGRKEVKPDVVIVSLAEWQRALMIEDKRDARLCPLLPIEVRSPGNRPKEILQKVHLYLENGALAVWLLDSQEGGIWVFSREAHPLLIKGSINTPFPLPQYCLNIGATLRGEQTTAYRINAGNPERLNEPRSWDRSRSLLWPR
jgi:Uma2 family endonuclease